MTDTHQPVIHDGLGIAHRADDGLTISSSAGTIAAHTLAYYRAFRKYGPTPTYDRLVREFQTDVQIDTKEPIK